MDEIKYILRRLEKIIVKYETDDVRDDLCDLYGYLVEKYGNKGSEEVKHG